MKEVILVFLGDTHLTIGIMQLISEGIISKEDVIKCLHRHLNLDYGDTDPHDAGVNDRNLNHNCGTVHSSYMINENRIWIITSIGDIDTTNTVVLLPNEY